MTSPSVLGISLPVVRKADSVSQKLFNSLLVSLAYLKQIPDQYSALHSFLQEYFSEGQQGQAKPDGRIIEEWEALKAGAELSTANLFFLKEMIIPLAYVHLKETNSHHKKQINAQLIRLSDFIESEISKRKSGLLTFGYDDRFKSFLNRAVEAADAFGQALENESKPVTFKQATNQLLEAGGQSPFYPRANLLLRKLEACESFINAKLGIKSEQEKEETKQKSPKWWSTITGWFKRIGAWVGWLFKALLVAALIAAIAYISIQGATILTVALLVTAALSAASAFLWPYAIKCYNWLTGKSVVNSIKTSDFVKEVFSKTSQFIFDDCLRRPQNLSDRDFLSLGQRYLFIRHLHESLQQTLKDPFKFKNIWFRKKAYKDLQEISEYCEDLKTLLNDAISLNVDFIVQKIGKSLFESPELTLDLVSPLRAEDLRAFVQQYGSPEQIKKFNDESNIQKQLIRRLGTTFLYQVSTSHRTLNTDFGTNSPNIPSIQQFIASVQCYQSSPTKELIVRFLEILKFDTRTSAAELEELLEQLFDTEEAQASAREALSLHIYKSTMVYNVDLISLLNEEHKTKICEVYIENEQRLRQMISRFTSALSIDESSFTSDVDDFLQLLQISELHAHITGNHPSIQAQFKAQLDRCIQEYQGGPLRAIHDALLRCLPLDEQDDARQQVAQRRLACLIDQADMTDEAALEITDADIDFLLHPKVNVGQTFWEHIDGLSMPANRLVRFIQQGVTAGILPPSAFFASQYILSLPQGSPLRAICSDEHDDQHSSWHLSLNALALEIAPSLQDCTSVLQVQRIFDEHIPPQARFELLVHINPAHASRYYQQLPRIREVSIRSQEQNPGNRRGNTFLERLRQLESPAGAISTLPFVLAHRQAGRAGHLMSMPTGDMSTVSPDQFLALCENTGGGILFALRAIRDLSNFENFKANKPFCFKNPTLLIEYIIAGFRFGEFHHHDPRILNERLIGVLYDLLDSKTPENFSHACRLVGERLIGLSDDFDIEEVGKIVDPIANLGQQFSVLPSATTATQLLSHTPDRANSFWTILANYPQSHNARKFVVHQMSFMAETGAFFEGERQKLRNMMENLIGIHPHIPADIIQLYTTLSVPCVRRSAIAKRFLRDAINIRGFFTGNHNLPIIRRAARLIGHLEYNEGVHGIINTMFKKADANSISTHELNYIEGLDCSAAIKALYVYNRIKGSLGNYHELEVVRERFLSAIEEARNSGLNDPQLLAYKQYCAPRRVLNVPNTKKFIADREASFSSKLQ